MESGDDVDLSDLPSSSSDDGNLRKKNAAALHAIHATSSTDIFFGVKALDGGKEDEKIERIHSEISSGDEKIERIHSEISSASEEREYWNTEMSEGGEGEDEKTEMSEGLDGGKEDKMIEELTKSICKGDWNAVEKFFFEDNHPLDSIILSVEGYTALHVAIQAGQDNIVEKLVNRMSIRELGIKTKGLRHTCLTLAAMTGRTHVAKCIVKRNNELLTVGDEGGHDLLTVGDKGGHVPVRLACSTGRKEMTQYLYSVTPPKVFRQRKFKHGFDLMRWAIDNKMLDICLDLLQRNPDLSVSTGKSRVSPILKLSHQPSIFFSGRRLRFWQRWIYHWLKVKPPATSLKVRNPVTHDQDPKERNTGIQGLKVKPPTTSLEVRIPVTHDQDPKARNTGIQELKVKPPTTSLEVRIPVTHDQDPKERNTGIQAFDRLRRLGLMLLKFFGIKQIYDLKLMHLYADKILHHMCNHVSRESLRKCGVIDAMFEAAKQGIVEIVVALLKVSQPVNHRNKHNRHVFTIAIQYRQENIFNLLYGMPDAWKARILCRLDKHRNSMLHVAGEKHPNFQLARISSPALQMQRELQWFKEVERIVPEWCKEFKNKRGKTPSEVFSKNHRKLAKEAGKWMRGIARSFIIVGALIVTIMFAAAFTVPGSNNQYTEFPIFLHKRLFMTFIISDAVSFFAASTSVLLFLGILTSRFAQEDFLVSLPKKLIIGLSTLFISIAAMMVCFCATLLIMLQDRWCAIIPIITMATIPVTLFIWLQFPLLQEIVVSTYAPGIFNRNMRAWL